MRPGPDAAPVSEEAWRAQRADSLAHGVADVAARLGAASLPAVLLPYQASLLALTAREQFVICEKSRRIGMTWAVGADAVLTSAAARSAGGMDTLYIGYNLDMAREFIDTCAMWAKAFIKAAGAVSEFLFTDQDEATGETRQIAAFRIRFASGFEIVALTSKPRSLRGRQGYVIFDEAAFHDALGELIKAAMALLMWGGKVLVISTHDGVENPFNELVEEVRSGKRRGKVLRVAFDEAIAEGLYERIALVKGLEASDEAKSAWIASIFAFYGDDADEELRCIPKSGMGVYLTRAAIEACMEDRGHVARLTCPAGFELRPMIERVAYFERWIEDNVTPALLTLDPRRRAAIGEDFARSMDLTVIALGQETDGVGYDVPLIVELGNCPIAQQKQVLRAMFEAPRRMGGACFDASGNGLGLAEWAQETYGFERIEAIKITSQWYLETMPKLKARIEDRTIALPRDGEIRDDLRVIKLVRGIPSIPDKRTGGRHGDAAVALAMLVRALEIEVADYGYEAAGGARSRYAPGDEEEEGDMDDRPRGRVTW